jgi:hypothetical protein
MASLESGLLREGTILTRKVPNEGMKRSLQYALITFFIFGFIACLSVWFISGSIDGLIVGLISGVIFGMIVGLEKGGKEVIKHYVFRLLLVQPLKGKGRMPVLPSECHERQISCPRAIWIP